MAAMKERFLDFLLFLMTRWLLSELLLKEVIPCSVFMCLARRVGILNPFRHTEHLELVWHREWLTNFFFDLKIRSQCLQANSPVSLIDSSTFNDDWSVVVCSSRVSLSELILCSFMWKVNKVCILNPLPHVLHRNWVWQISCFISLLSDVKALLQNPHS